MHVQGEQDFAKWLRELGQGSLNDQNDDVILPRSLRCSTNDIGGLIDHVYRSIHTSESHPDDYFKQRCIFAPRDGEVHETNKIVLERFPGPLHDAWSVNEAYKPQTKILFEDIAIEDLHVICPPGFPLARLSLKVGCPVVFLRDVPDASKGSRGIVTKTGVRVMEVRLLSGETMLVPRVPHEVEVTADLPFGRRKIRLRRLQFPVDLGFAMTIDKAQGQTFSTVGVDLRSPCFAHGQLYLALSRASSSAGIKCIVGTGKGESKTKNIVYREVVEALSQASSHRPPCVP